jgi:hypothetical protein
MNTTEVDNSLEMDLKETGYGGVKWIHLVHTVVHYRALLNKAMNLRVQ